MPSLRHSAQFGFGFAALACGLALLATGCQKRTVQAAPPVVIVAAPVETQPASEAQPPAQPAAQPEAPATNPPPAPVTPPAKPPAKKPATTPKDNPESDSTPPKPAAPQISPQMSTQELANYQRLTNDDIAATEADLARARNHNLNAAQRDLVEKINSFLTQAREAIREPDWVRARNLAQKARVLSIELKNSLE